MKYRMVAIKAPATGNVSNMEQELANNTPPQQAPSGNVGLDRVRALGELVRRKRVAERLTLQQAGEQSGVSAATLSRMERQATAKQGASGPIPDIRTLTSVAHWLGVSLDQALEGGPTKPSPTLPSIPQEAGTPEIVEAYLRADRNLDPGTAGVLAHMFRLAYDQFAVLSGPPHTKESNDAEEST